MAATFDEVNNLRNIARQKHAILAPAHVFMFADYIQMYIKSVRASESIKQITVVWTDPKSETRYGEKKSYDPGLPIIADLLPHIISLSSALFKQVNPIFSNIALTKGGQNVLMELKYGSIPCAIKMARNDASRKRFIKVDTVSSSIELDFTNEPAIFKYTSDKNAVTLEIVNEDRPLRKLLRMFLAGCSSGSLDNRFDLEVGLQISQITDQAINAYEKLQTSWIFDNISGEIEEDMVYAITETFQVNKILNSEQLEQSITEFQNWLYYMNKCHQKIDIADIQLKLKSISSILKD
jgi:predicted dehydrogenase